MSEVVGGAIVRKAGEAAAETTQGLLVRMFGPWADDFGQDLVTRRQRRKQENAELVLRRAVEKSDAHGRRGTANLRAAEAILDEGAACDDELMAEYFSGLLSGSQTPDGRDDRAVFWAKLVGGLSSMQVRLHFLLYRGWAEELRGRDGLNLGIDHGRRSARADVATTEVVMALVGATNAGGSDLLGSALFHSVTGLYRVGLIGAHTWGPRNQVDRPDSPYENVLWVEPTTAGFELFGWALGYPSIEPNHFLNMALPGLDPSLGRLTTFSVPGREGEQSVPPG